MKFLNWALDRVFAALTWFALALLGIMTALIIPVSGALVMCSTLADALRRPSAEPEVDYLDRVFMNKAGRHV
jgi:hypothetical protein